MADILHITPHLGGGIGNVVSGLCINDRENSHSIVCLEEPVNRRYYDRCVLAGVPVCPAKGLKERLEAADIVQVEWWHHPLTAGFMTRVLDGIRTRLLVWSHISGCNYPCIPFALTEAVDAFVFATPYSFDNPYWTAAQRETAKENAFLVISSGNDYSRPPLPRRPHPDFCVGYVGFLGYEKTSRRFVQICERCADIPGIRFVVVGDLKDGKELLADAQSSQVWEKFDFRGYSGEVERELAGFDLFACLLGEQHTGASENALLEAMHAGVCPVVMKQCTEQYLVEDGVTGVVCGGEDAFVRAVHELYADPERRERLGREASRYVGGQLSIGNTVAGMAAVYAQVMEKEKRLHDLTAVLGSSGYEWFLSCYRGGLDQIGGLAAGKSKGSVSQYYRYTGDVRLKKLMEKINYGNENRSEL